MKTIPWKRQSLIELLSSYLILCDIATTVVHFDIEGFIVAVERT